MRITMRMRVQAAMVGEAQDVLAHLPGMEPARAEAMLTALRLVAETLTTEQAYAFHDFFKWTDIALQRSAATPTAPRAG